MRALTSVIICTNLLVLITVVAGVMFYLRILDKSNVEEAQDDIGEWMYDLNPWELERETMKPKTQAKVVTEKMADPVSTDSTPIKEAAMSNNFLKLNFTQMSQNLGYQCVEYDVVTQDGYLLKVFRVKGSTDTLPVLLVHSFLDSADSFILRGAHSLVGALNSAGRDIWIVNFRGNKYSRQHLTLNPDTDKSYWSFSFHEHGIYDLTAVIDFVLRMTAQNRLQVLSYSQGSTALFAMTSTLPEYSKKVVLVVLMAPICYLANIKTLLPNFMFVDTVVNTLLSSLGNKEIFADYFHLANLMKKFCSLGLLKEERCIHGYLLKGDSDEIKMDFLPLLSAHYPAGTSMRNLRHMTQLYLKNSFAQYDYGFLQNIFVYGSTTPPRYDVSKLSMKVAMFVARNDEISSWKDVQVLRRDLPNVAEHRVVHRKSFNHVDYIWGQNVYKHLYPQVVEVLQKYGN